MPLYVNFNGDLLTKDGKPLHTSESGGASCLCCVCCEGPLQGWRVTISGVVDGYCNYPDATPRLSCGADNINGTYDLTNAASSGNALICRRAGHFDNIIPACSHITCNLVTTVNQPTIGITVIVDLRCLDTPLDRGINILLRFQDGGIVLQETTFVANVNNTANNPDCDSLTGTAAYETNSITYRFDTEDATIQFEPIKCPV